MNDKDEVVIKIKEAYLRLDDINLIKKKRNLKMS